MRFDVFLVLHPLINMNCFDFHIALNIIWLALSISNMVVYLLQCGWKYQVVTIAASLAFAII